MSLQLRSTDAERYDDTRPEPACADSVAVATTHPRPRTYPSSGVTKRAKPAYDAAPIPPIHGGRRLVRSGRIEERRMQAFAYWVQDGSASRVAIGLMQTQQDNIVKPLIRF